MQAGSILLATQMILDHQNSQAPLQPTYLLRMKAYANCWTYAVLQK